MLFHGKYMGYLRDMQDPEKRGRIRVYCPEVVGPVDDADHWLDWALPCFPWFTHYGVGLSFVPEKVSDWAAWIEFRHGDPRFPIWCGLFPLVPVSKDQLRLDALKQIKAVVADCLLRIRPKGDKPIQAGSESAAEAVVLGTSYRRAEKQRNQLDMAAIQSLMAASQGPMSALQPGFAQLYADLQAFEQAAAITNFLSKVLFTEYE